MAGQQGAASRQIAFIWGSTRALGVVIQGSFPLFRIPHSSKSMTLITSLNSAACCQTTQAVPAMMHLDTYNLISLLIPTGMSRARWCLLLRPWRHSFLHCPESICIHVTLKTERARNDFYCFEIKEASSRPGSAGNLLSRQR